MVKETLESMLDFFLDEHLQQLVFSNPAGKDGLSKVKVRPVMLKGELKFQAEELSGKQAFHHNLSGEEAKEYAKGLLTGKFRQAEASSQLGSATVLVAKKGSMTVKVKRAAQPCGKEAALFHNRQKQYVLKEGIPVPFLVDLGVMTAEGEVVRARYAKFRQVNRFLEFIEDVLPKLSKTKENTILDFGCGKSYLTFAMYHYLNQVKGYPVRIIGLDLKKDVVARCNLLAEKYGYGSLAFYHGDIADYEEAGQVDMVVTLHACDTATDYALAKAVRWKAKVILSVPCCQHELNRQMANDLMKPVFSYGVIKERMAALYTDALRAEFLEGEGYRTQILEFIDMEHTPKNLLIRAVREGKRKENQEQIRQLTDFLQVEPMLGKLLGFK
ncbi:SAM-dependent methyltransferase [Clostridiaceae bacterium]|nr:SAM-dependent methyltransferase [Clostridiaceae bacterium]RKI11492.1 SAM-dependent methyltransferase [bacterium 1XD21-70]